jgi:hypothetical protein
MKLLKTNTIIYKENIKKAMEDRFEYIEVKSFNEILMRFDNEYNHAYEKKKNPVLRDRISEWLLSGGGFGFIYEYEYLNFTSECHKIESVPLDKEEAVVKYFNNHLATWLIRFADYEIVDNLY